MNKKGFTLTELLVVIAILMVVMSGSIFGLQKISEEAKIKSLKRIKRQLQFLSRKPQKPLLKSSKLRKNITFAFAHTKT